MKYLQFFLLTFFLLICSIVGFAQNVIHGNQIWIQYFNVCSLTDSMVNIVSDASIRMNTLAEAEWNTYTLRAGVRYPIKAGFFGVTGAAFFVAAKGNRFIRWENRLYQEISKQLNAPIDHHHRLRIEYRHFQNRDTSDLNFNNFELLRLRYRILFSIPISKNIRPGVLHGLSLSFGDEVFLNYGKSVVYNTFDNNRILIGATTKIGKLNSAAVFYIYQIGPRNLPNLYDQYQILTISFTHILK